MIQSLDTAASVTAYGSIRSMVTEWSVTAYGSEMRLRIIRPLITEAVRSLVTENSVSAYGMKSEYGKRCLRLR